jgi:hypothetical protein
LTQLGHIGEIVIVVVGEGGMDNDEIELIEAEILKHQRHLEAMERVEGEFVRSFQEAALATYLNIEEAPGRRRRFSDLLDTVFYNRVLSFRIRALIRDLEDAKRSKCNKKRARGEDDEM